MYEGKMRNAGTERLAKALLSLQNEEECLCLLEDLCTYKEINDLAQRLEVARMLRDKEKYADIVQKTGMSSATISRVKRALLYGEGGYNIVLDRIGSPSEEETEND